MLLRQDFAKRDRELVGAAGETAPAVRAAQFIRDFNDWPSFDQTADRGKISGASADGFELDDDAIFMANEEGA